MSDQKTKDDFPQPLRDFLEIDSDGHVRFSYPRMCGQLQAQMEVARDLLAGTGWRRGKEKAARVQEALAYLEVACASAKQIDKLWTAHVDEGIAARRAAQDARRAAHLAKSEAHA